MHEFESIDRVDFLKHLCKGKRVLHLGCTDHPYTLDAIKGGTFLHAELESVAGEIWGVDGDADGLMVLRQLGHENIFQADLEQLEKCDLEGNFDVIVAGEIIEHLNNPGLFLTGVQRFMGPKSQLVITSVNAYCAMRFFYYGTRGNGGRREPVHPDHIAYYSYSTLKLVIERHGLSVEQFHFYDIGAGHRKFLRWYAKLVNDVFVWLAPHLSDGVIAVCGLNPGSGS